ncbi:MAG: glycosyltransferase family 2 protein [Hyphomonas sp.]
MSGPPEFSVLIVNYNGGAYLQGAIDSLKAQTCRSFEVIVVDNASTDGSASALDTAGLPGFTLMAETENHGFARGNNLAAEKATGRWLALLNPDARAAPDWLAALKRAIDTHDSVRTFASAQLLMDDPGTLDGAGDAYLLFGFPWRGGFGRPSRELPGPGYCFSACGASAVYDAALYRSLGGFDERFYCYCEDVDLGFRLQLMGEDCYFVPDAVIEHAGSGTTGRDSEFTTYHGTRNRIWTYVKNMPPGLMALTLPGHVALTLYVLARNSFTPRFLPMMRGIWDGVRGAAQLRTSPDWRVKQRGAPVRSMAWNPWRMSQRRAHVRPAV